MRDSTPNIMLRRQNVERKALAPLVAHVDDRESDHAEPAFSTRLCGMIVAYWRAHGHQVSAWVETEAGTIGRVYTIRTSGVPVRGA